MSLSSPQHRQAEISPPAGSNSVWERDLGWGRLLTLNARAGSFKARFSGHAVVVGEGPVAGPVSLNGRPVAAPDDRTATYSVFRPNDEVAGQLHSAVVYHFLFFDPDFVSQTIHSETAAENVNLVPVMRGTPQATFQSLWRWMISSARSATEAGDEMGRLCARILLVLLVEPQLANRQAKASDRHGEAVSRVQAHVFANLSGRLELIELAALAGMSPYHFARVFKARTGQSVHQFVLESRLEGARGRLSRSSAAISEIAKQTGFSSQSHLTTAFRKRFGLAPKAYRVQAGSGAG